MMKRKLAIAFCVAMCVVPTCIAGCAPGVEGTTSSVSGTGAGGDAVSPAAGSPAPWAIDPDEASPPEIPPWEREAQPAVPMPVSVLTKNKIIATITMEDGSEIVAELYPDVAPQTVRNFVYLARLGFYDGLTFHRIMTGFMIQGGCPQGTGYGNPGYSIWGEFTENGFTNDLKHARGVLSMARGGENNSAGSQFFIMHATAASLNLKYAAFGKVISGMDVVDEIAKTPVTDNNGSVARENQPIIKSITIEDDVELPPPEKLSR